MYTYFLYTLHCYFILLLYAYKFVQSHILNYTNIQDANNDKCLFYKQIKLEIKQKKMFKHV